MMTGRKLNTHQTFRKLRERLLNILCTFRFCVQGEGGRFLNEGIALVKTDITVILLVGNELMFLMIPHSPKYQFHCWS